MRWVEDHQQGEKTVKRRINPLVDHCYLTHSSPDGYQERYYDKKCKCWIIAFFKHPSRKKTLWCQTSGNIQRYSLVLLFGHMLEKLSEWGWILALSFYKKTSVTTVTSDWDKRISWDGHIRIRYIYIYIYIVSRYFSVFFGGGTKFLNY